MFTYKITIAQSGNAETGFLDNTLIQYKTETPYLVSKEDSKSNALSVSRWKMLQQRLSFMFNVDVSDIECDATESSLATSFSFIISTKTEPWYTDDDDLLGEEAIQHIIAESISKTDNPVMVKLVYAAPTTSTDDDKDFSRIGIVEEVELVHLFDDIDSAKSSIGIETV